MNNMNHNSKSNSRSNQAVSARNSTFEYSTLESRIVLDGSGYEWVVLADNSQLDDQGRITVQEVSYDTDGDSIADLITKGQFQYNADGSVASSVYEEDFGADGIVDSRYSNSMEYSASGQLIVSTDSWDSDGNGTVDSQTRTTWSYDENGEMVSGLAEQDMDGDGVYESSYDPMFTTYDGGTGGGWNVVSEETQVDDLGRVVSQELVVDTDGDGVADLRTVDSYEYGAGDSIVNYTNEQDVGADGSVDSRQVDTYEYDADGVHVAIHSQFDSNGDGEIDSEYTIDMGDMMNFGGELPLFAMGSDGGPAPNERTVDSPALPSLEGNLNLMAVGASLAGNGGALLASPLTESFGPTSNAIESQNLNSSNRIEVSLAGSLALAETKSNAAERDNFFAARSVSGHGLLDNDDLNSTLLENEGNGLDLN